MGEHDSPPCINQTNFTLILFGGWHAFYPPYALKQLLKTMLKTVENGLRVKREIKVEKVGNLALKPVYNPLGSFPNKMEQCCKQVVVHDFNSFHWSDSRKVINFACY